MNALLRTALTAGALFGGCAVFPTAGLGQGGMSASEPPPVVISYFYEPGCRECAAISNEVLPVLRAQYEGFYMLDSRDVGVESNYVLLVRYQEKFRVAKNEPVSMVVDDGEFLCGFDRIAAGLCVAVAQAVEKRMDPAWRPAVSPDVELTDVGLVQERLKNFTALTLAGAGLVDGINPCAISTLVFFMSLLGVAKVTGRGLLTMGISFCLASFVTYTALGFGLLRALYLFEGFPAVRMTLEMAMVGLLTVFAYLSFRDAYRYGKTGDAHQVALQLPDGVKARIHSVMRSGLGLGSLALGGLMIGAVVTALESLCTGQLYVPTLVLLIKSGKSASAAWRWLLLYNLMFVLPVVLVFLLTYFGLRTPGLLAWSKRNVVISKIVLGVFFLAMGLLLVVKRSRLL